MKPEEATTCAGTLSLHAVLATMGTFIVAPAVAAQSVAPARGVDSTQLEEVVVTAQKRTQVLLDVPQSISVISGDALERQQATTLADFTGLVPGLTLQQPNPGEARVILRGINTGGASPTVGVYVDETPFGSSTGLTNGASLAADIDPFDLERIEVLRGPQGTLYGANSLGGVLRFITAAPVLGEYRMRGQTGIETVDGGGVGWSANAVGNVPIGDTLAIRASGFYREEPGFIEASGPNAGRNINDLRGSGGRISALAKPTDALSIRLTALLQDIRSDAGPGFDADPVTLRPASVDPVSGEALSGFTRTQQTLADEQHAKYRFYNATINWDLGFAEVTSVTSYGQTLLEKRNDSSFERTDLGLLGDVTSLLYGLFEDVPGPLGTTYDAQIDQKKYTQELRLASPDSDKLEWMIGAYYTREPGRILQQMLPFDVATRRFIDQRITLGPPLLPPGVTLPFDKLIAADVHAKYKEYAGFGSATWHVTPRFEITGGARYSHNDVSTVQTLEGALNFGSSTLRADSSENISTWSLAPRFEVNDHVSVYARVAKGYRPGGPNVLPPGAPADIAQQFESDTLISYEAGIRGETPDRTFLFDVSVYYLDWRNIQVIVTYDDPNLGPIDLDGNGKKGKSQGAELTTTFRPMRGLNLVLNAAYNDAKLKGDLPPIGGVVPGFDGDRLPFAPEWTASASADHEWPVGGRATAFVGASIRWISEQATDFDPGYLDAFGRRLVIDGYETVDLRAGVDFDKFNLTLFAKNATNSDGLIHAGDYLTRPGDLVTATPLRPRTIGATVGFSF